MSSDSQPTPSEMQSILERLISSRNRDLSMFLPFLFGLTAIDPTQSSTRSEPDESSTDPDDQIYRDRIVLINPLSQGMVVIEGEGLDSLLRGVQTKDGPPPASKSSMEAMPRVEIMAGEETECVICLEECGIGSVVKEMPCKHKYHGPCIEKWLGLHGSCPVCRYKMPVDEEDGGKKREEEGGERRRGHREIWVSFSFGHGRRRTDDVEERESVNNEGNSRNSVDDDHHDDGNQRDQIQSSDDSEMGN